MRQGGLETAPRFLKCGSRECVLSGLRQATDQSWAIGEGSRLEEMVSDVAGTLVDSTRIEPLDRVGDGVVQLLSTRTRNAGQ
jgi:hypothetical protein